MTNLSELPFVTPADITEHWMEAWHGGTVLREYLSRRSAGVAADPEYLPYWANQLATGKSVRTGYNRYGNYAHVTTLPEAALDWPIYRAAILAPIDEVLYPAGDPDSQWEVETIEYVAAAVADAKAAKPFTVPRVERCPRCGHESHATYAPCADCDEAAEVGQYAPCNLVEGLA